VALLDQANNAPGDEAGNLDNANLAMLAGDNQTVAFIILARLVEVGIDELAGRVDDFANLAGHGRAIHMAIENAHEDGDAVARLFTEAELARRHADGYCHDASVG